MLLMGIQQGFQTTNNSLSPETEVRSANISATSHKSPSRGLSVGTGDVAESDSPVRLDICRLRLQQRGGLSVLLSRYLLFVTGTVLALSPLYDQRFRFGMALAWQRKNAS
jgi:hypothetical protein